MIVGTAGHIDHGKTSLVKALTGVDTDRLKEEKARGITIELGFAYLPLPGGDVLGFVDVPGHERFVHTMLAGATGIDFVVLIVAADDGVMPQTREHLQVLDLLGLSEGIVALTKIDLVDSARRAEVMDEIAAALAGTTLEGADILPVSAITGEGIEALKMRLLEEAESRPLRPVRGAFRLAVDRAFSLAGAGTVVTGPVTSGRIGVDDRVLILPAGIEARVRSIHAQNRPAKEARAGERAALNLAGPGVSKDRMGRGDWLTDPAFPHVTARFDARLRLLASETRELRHWSPVYFHAGTSAMTARVVLLSAERLAPGAAALAQVVLPAPLPLRHGDRFVLRDVSAERTIGGGMVIDPRAPERRRRTPERLARLEALSASDPRDALAALVIEPPGLVDLATFAADRSMLAGELDAAVRDLDLVVLSGQQGSLTMTAETLDTLSGRIVDALATFHARSPDQAGQSEERLRLAFPAAERLPRPMFSIVLAHLAKAGKVVLFANAVRLPGHGASLAPADEKLWARMRPLIEAEPFRPPLAREIVEKVGQPLATVRRVLKTLARMRELTEVATDRFFRPDALADLALLARDLGAASPEQTFAAAAFKERAGCGRNVAIQILEHFDRNGLTVRQGDVRRVAKDPAKVFPRAGRREAG